MVVGIWFNMEWWEWKTRHFISGGRSTCLTYLIVVSAVAEVGSTFMSMLALKKSGVTRIYTQCSIVVFVQSGA